MAGISRWSLADGHRLARTVGRNLRNAAHYTTVEFIEAAEKAAGQHPKEWVVFYALGDKYQQVGRYVDALRACKRCVELRPNDIRSVYALATAYNLLTRAEWAGKEEMVPILDAMRDIAGERDLIDPSLSQAELDKTGLIVETAAAQAMRWFERALTLKPDRQSRQQIEWDLQTLYKRFPHLQH
jgi:tetratricopeptide (TPR) repeat protein